MQGKPEVEVVDMILKLKSKISKCKDENIPINKTTIEQLKQRLEEIICSVPDDLKNILQSS